MDTKIADYQNKNLPKEVRLESLRQEIQKGIDAMRAGNFRTCNSTEELNDYLEEIIKEARIEFEAKKKKLKLI